MIEAKTYGNKNPKRHISIIRFIKLIKSMLNGNKINWSVSLRPNNNKKMNIEERKFLIEGDFLKLMLVMNVERNVAKKTMEIKIECNVAGISMELGQ